MRPYAMIDLKPVTRADAAIIFAAWGRYPENFDRLTARVFGSVADADRYLADLFSSPANVAFHIVHHDGTVVGIVKVIVTGHRAQIGYVVHAPFSGRGIATEAVGRVVSILEAMPAIGRIWATCALDNPASARVLEKCGFECEAILKTWVIYPACGNQAADNYSYVKLRPGMPR